jgi:hypothetical protein
MRIKHLAGQYSKTHLTNAFLDVFGVCFDFCDGLTCAHLSIISTTLHPSWLELSGWMFFLSTLDYVL